jgi:Fe-S cluster biogenesis protein NfuA
MDLGFRMHAERTPNPNSIKWVLGQRVIADSDGVSSATFSGAAEATVSPLAAAILAIEDVESVLLGPSFVTVTKAEDAEWTSLAAPIVAEIKAWAARGISALGPDFERPEVQPDDEVVRRIRAVLDRDVRPYVESDGGEVAFVGFQDGVVEVVLRGACAGCPSSSVTLKLGIEARLKEEIPEVESVIAV